VLLGCGWPAVEDRTLEIERNLATVGLAVELGGRVVRVLDSGQLHQSERSWVRFLDGPLKNCQASGQSRGHVASG